jgi:outer membrane cobalamin receptor
MKPTSLTLLLWAAATVTFSHARAEEAKLEDVKREEPKLEDMSLEDLLNVKVEVASRRSQTIQKSPGIVSLVTAEEIRNAGARDLIDVLHLLPGFTFATDTEGVIGIAIRGNWGHEGKVLLLIDGIELNEMFYGTLQFGHHIPVDTISRVEVIRGPGSAIYGGHAELAVINVISKKAAEIKGAEARAAYARMETATNIQDLGLSAGKEFRNGWSVVSHAATGGGDRSDLHYSDFAGDTFDMRGNSDIRPTYVNLGAATRDFGLRLIYDSYKTMNRTAYGTNVAAPVNLDFDSLLFGAKYSKDLTGNFSLVNEFQYRRQEPWKSTDPLSTSIADLHYDKYGQEVLGRVVATQKFSDHFQGHVGTEITHQAGTDRTTGGVWANGMSSMFINRQALFAELSSESETWNLTAGGRYQNQDGTGSKFVPRFSAVKQMGDFHAKALFSMGYRSPDFENLNVNPEISPETTEDSELEFGYKLNADSLLTLNLFYTKIKDPIIYVYVAGDEYFNFDATGTFGGELDYRLTKGWGYFDVNYSFYHPHSSHVPKYQAGEKTNLLLGLPAHKLTANANVKISGPDLRINVSATYLSERYGYDWDGTAMSLQRFKPVTLLDTYLERRNLLVKNLDLGAGVHNLLNEDFRYIEAYNGDHPPEPAQSISWMVKANYKMEFD